MAEPIGRHHECRSISGFLDALAAGRGGVMLIEGEGGTGKTTLAEWAMHDASERGFEALAGRSWEMSQSVPYEPIVAALGRFLRTLTPEDRAELTTGLSSLSALIDGLELAAPQVGAGSVSRARLHDAVATLLARVAAGRPAVFFIDDLHWSDVSTLELLQFICRDFPYVALGIIATVRPGDADDRTDVRSFLAPLRRAMFCSSVTVRNLDRVETIALLADRLGAAPPERLVELVWARSIGTPLLVHEMVEDLRSRELLIHTEHGWSITDPNPPLPRVAADLIHDRIERAAPAERGLLEILAVADEPTALDVLVAVSNLPASEIEDRLSQLISKRLVTEVVEPAGVITWHAEHPIIGHVVAAELDSLVRQRLHRQLLAAAPTAPVARRARHVAGGGRPIDPASAIETLVEAGEVAQRHGANSQALTNFETAAAFAAQRSDSEHTASQLFRIHLGLGATLTRVRRLDEAAEVLERAWRYATQHANLAERLRTLTLLDDCHFLSGASAKPILDRLDQLNEQLRVDEDWDGLIEVHFFRFLVTGRNGLGGAEQLAQSLGQIKDRPMGARARLILELLELGGHVRGLHPGMFEPSVRRLLEVTQQSGDWDLRRRAGLMAIDLAAHVGEPESLELAIIQTRAVEVEVGERPNWRIPIQRAMAAVVDGRELGDMADLVRVGQVERARKLIAFVRALEHRYRFGPDAALDYLEEITAGERPKDLVAQLYELLARVVVGEGSEREAQLAHDAVTGSAVPSLGSFNIAYFNHGRLLAATTAGTEADVRAARGELLSGNGSADLCEAWRAISMSRLATSKSERASKLVKAAECLHACGHRLEAASRWVEAAEVDRDAVSEERLVQSAQFARTCGADWVLTRAIAVAPAASTTGAVAVETGLTRREWEVAGQVAKGLTNREVAQELFISIRTVTSHLDHIYTKLAISSRDDLAAYVAERGANT